MVANYLILVELNSGRHFLFHSPLPFYLNFDQDLGSIVWPFCHRSLRMSIPGRSSAITHPVLVTVALILWTTCLTRLSAPGNGSFLLLLPISRVTLLLSWILASIQSGQSFQVNVFFLPEAQSHIC